MSKYLAINLLVTFLFVSGCASIGNDFELNDANKIKNGMTRDEVISTMHGQKPYQVSNSTFTYLYSRANWFTGSNSARKVTITFDDNGKVVGVPKGGYFNVATNPNYVDDRPW